jgi:predicted DNA-binding protein with PD1-like motif
MKYSEAKQGRVFIIRLEDGDIIHESIEKFAREKKIRSATLIILGGADDGSKLVVGPKDGRASPVVPMDLILQGAHEVTGTGTIFPNEKGEHVLHMHISAGRGNPNHESRSTNPGLGITGCVRKGVKTWHVLEVILFELVGSNAKRRHDKGTGFELLEP